MWVAYITKAETPQPIPDTLKYYSPDNLHDYPDMFAKDIEMVVTVTSSPEALITSYMGITFSVERAFSRTKGTSPDLHSFAAKVMLKRNPERKFMINAPALAMEEIILKALPKDIFVGTQEMQKIMKERQEVNFERYAESHQQKYENKLRVIAQKNAQNYNEDLEAYLTGYKKGELENKDLTETLIRKMFSERIEPYEMIEMGPEGIIISEEQISVNLLKKLKDDFMYYKNPYSCPGVKEVAKRTEEFLKLMEKHPPILSVRQDHFMIFNPQELLAP